jgi:tetratricopeptide (TPR) repeat protein
MFFIIGIIFLICAVGTCGVESAVAARNSARHDAALVSAIAADLNSNDPAVWQDGLARLHDLAGHRPRVVLFNFYHHGFKAMLARGLDDDIEKLAVQAIDAAPRSSTQIAQMQECRVRALLAQGKYDQALSAAKAYYNVCILDDTGIAIDLLDQAMQQTLATSDPAIILRFKRQQDAGAVVPETIDKPLTLAAELGQNVLKSIKVSDPAIEQRLGKENTKPDSFAVCMGRGNLLLLLDRADDARSQFERALQLADEQQTQFAVGSIARAIRAEDGAIGRANGYILKLRAGAADDKVTR